MTRNEIRRRAADSIRKGRKVMVPMKLGGMTQQVFEGQYHDESGRVYKLHPTKGWRVNRYA